jgi:hypothetical protein
MLQRNGLVSWKFSVTLLQESITYLLQILDLDRRRQHWQTHYHPTRLKSQYGKKFCSTNFYVYNKKVAESSCIKFTLVVDALNRIDD